MIKVTSLLILVAALGCTRDVESPIEPTLYAGRYVGQFVRSSPNVRVMPTAIILNLEDNRFLGSSESPKHPAICEGRFSITGSTITFFDECLWTAEFDWTLILNGKYTLSPFADNTISFFRDYGNGIMDTYTLTLSPYFDCSPK